MKNSVISDYILTIAVKTHFQDASIDENNGSFFYSVIYFGQKGTKCFITQLLCASAKLLLKDSLMWKNKTKY